MKNPHFLSWNPRYHRIDPHLRVHAFYCVAALTFISLINQELAKHKITMSLETLMSELNAIRETTGIHFRKNAQPVCLNSISKMTDQQKQMFEIFNIGRFMQS